MISRALTNKKQNQHCWQAFRAMSCVRQAWAWKSLVCKPCWYCRWWGVPKGHLLNPLVV